MTIRHSLTLSAVAVASAVALVLFGAGPVITLSAWAMILYVLLRPHKAD